MEKRPRYSRESNVLEIALTMSARANGITIKEIEEEFGVSRRTAIRLKDSVMNVFPQVDVLNIPGKVKHYGFTDYSIKQLIGFTFEDVTTLEMCEHLITNDSLIDSLKRTKRKVEALVKKETGSIEDYIEFCLKTEGFAVRQLPHYKLDSKLLEVTQQALQQSKKLIGVYHDKERILEPLGLSYGEKTYLIAREPLKGTSIYTYILHKFTSLELSTENYKRGDFNLAEYLGRSFGVYQSDILDVKLQFDEVVAKDAAAYEFHHTQKKYYNGDGTLIVTFQASGSKEIIWHVFRWGKHCKILAPKILVDGYKIYLQDVLKTQV